MIATIAPQNNSDQAALLQSLNGSSAILSSALNSAIQKSRDDAQIRFNQEQNLINQQQRTIENNRAERVLDTNEDQFDELRKIQQPGIDLQNKQRQLSINRGEADFGFEQDQRNKLDAFGNTGADIINRQESERQLDRQRALDAELDPISQGKFDKENIIIKQKQDSQLFDLKKDEFKFKKTQIEANAQRQAEADKRQAEANEKLEAQQAIAESTAADLDPSNPLNKIMNVFRSEETELTNSIKREQALRQSGQIVEADQLKIDNEIKIQEINRKRTEINNKVQAQKDKVISIQKKIESNNNKLLTQKDPESRTRIEADNARLNKELENVVGVSKPDTQQTADQGVTRAGDEDGFLKQRGTSKGVQVTPAKVEEFKSLRENARISVSNGTDKNTLIENYFGVDSKSKKSGLNTGFNNAVKKAQQGLTRALNPDQSNGGIFSGKANEEDRDKFLRAAATRSFLEAYPNSEHSFKGRRINDLGGREEISPAEFERIFTDEDDKIAVEKIYTFLREIYDRELNSKSKSKSDFNNTKKF